MFKLFILLAGIIALISGMITTGLGMSHAKYSYYRAHEVHSS